MDSKRSCGLESKASHPVGGCSAWAFGAGRRVEQTALCRKRLKSQHGTQGRHNWLEKLKEYPKPIDNTLSTWLGRDF